MKKKSLYIVLAIAGTLSLGSCSLDEYNPSAGSSTIEHYDTWAGLQATCYSTLYHELYSKFDFEFISECGTDLWVNPADVSFSPEVFYYKGLGVSRQEPQKTWQQAYSIIATCNSVISNKENVTGGNDEDKEILAAEAKVIRAFMHLTLTTYFGPIPLCKNCVGEDVSTSPVRNSIQEVYNSVVTDLQEAADVLKDSPYGGNYARVTKKTAYGLLARAYAQGAGEGLADYWKKAKELTEDMINNPATYGLTGNELYADVSDMWAQDNNRGSVNKEYLFVAAGLDANGTDAANAGTYFNATSQLYAYMRANPNILQDLYPTQLNSNVYLGNHNQTGVMAPTKHAIDVFPEWDKRYENTFLTAYGGFTIDGKDFKKKCVVLNDDYLEDYDTDLETLAKTYGWDPSVVEDMVIYPYVNLKKKDATGGTQYYPEGIYEKGGTKKIVTTKNALVVDMPLTKGDDRFSIYLSKKDLTAQEKKDMAPVATINISDLYGNGSDYSTEYSANTYKFAEGATPTKANKLFPSMIKFNALYDGATRQLSNDGYPYRNPDIAIMRMAEIYLIAAEANVALGDGTTAAKYIEKLQKRATRSGYTRPEVTNVTEQDVLDEYAREFCGEHMRWAVLKRHRAIKSALQKYNLRAAASFDESIHYCRPIPQLFLDQITNKTEFGDNGYGYTGTKGY